MKMGKKVMSIRHKILLAVALTSLIWVIISLFYLISIIDKYENDVCGKINWSNIDGYNGTQFGGYSCYLKGDRKDIYFNPTIDNCVGCSKEKYHFICYTDYNYCFLAEKLQIIGGLFY